MRKRHQYRMLQAAFVFALIGLAFFGAYSGNVLTSQHQVHPEQRPAAPHQQHHGTSPPPTVDTQQQQYSGNPEHHWSDIFLDHLPDWFVALFTLLLAVITWRLVTSTNKLWEAGERQIKLATDTAQRQLRAYVVIDTCEAVATNQAGEFSEKHRLTPGNYATAIVAYKNTGQTPAYDVRVDGEAEFRKFPLIETDLDSHPTTEGSQGVLGRDSSREVYIKELSQTPLSGSRVQELGGGTYAFVVWGRITYQDIFGKEWRTDFRYFTGGTRKLIGVGMSAHDQGNDAA